MTTVVVSQPMYFPWPGFFELVATADVYVHLDDVQIADRGFTNRVQLKGAQGISWLTVPLKDRTHRKLIRDLEATGEPWRAKHRRMIEHALARTPHLAEALRLLDAAHAETGLVDLLIGSIEGPARYLGCWNAREVVRSSTLGVETAGSERILDLVRRLGGTRYVTAHGAANYLDHEAFERAGVAVEYVAYSRTPWRQRHGEFTPYVTVLDLVASEGPNAAAAIRPATEPWRTFLASRAG
jgi:hypothetical protein